MSNTQRESMVTKNFRVTPTLWREAAAIASERGDSLGEIVRGALRDYVREGRRNT